MRAAFCLAVMAVLAAASGDSTPCDCDKDVANLEAEMAQLKMDIAMVRNVLATKSKLRKSSSASDGASDAESPLWGHSSRAVRNLQTTTNITAIAMQVRRTVCCRCHSITHNAVKFVRCRCRGAWRCTPRAALLAL
jgi:hypothetical protein